MSVEICSNMSDAGDLHEGLFVAIVGANDMGDIVVWYASVKGGDDLLVVLVYQILTRLAEDLHDMYIGRAYACICVHL